MNHTLGIPAFPGETEGQTGPSTWRHPGMSLADYFATHAHIDDVNLAEADLIEAYGAAGILDTDPLTLRIRARYAVADAMLRVRGEP